MLVKGPLIAPTVSRGKGGPGWIRRARLYFQRRKVNDFRNQLIQQNQQYIRLYPSGEIRVAVCLDENESTRHVLAHLRDIIGRMGGIALVECTLLSDPDASINQLCSEHLADIALRAMWQSRSSGHYEFLLGLYCIPRPSKAQPASLYIQGPISAYAEEMIALQICKVVLDLVQLRREEEQAA